MLSEDEDRIARDLEQLAHVYNRVLDAGARLWTVATGQVELMHVALKGYMAQDFIRNLSAKTKRGMHSNAEKGLATGSRLYGYASQPGGGIDVVEEEAAVVRRIFAAYVAGDTPRDIAASLNAAAVPGPRGGPWAASTINGSRQRGNGVLNTELYAGVKVWNRFDMKKDRRTGKRISRAIPPDQWKRVDVPRLRIVDEETWTAARARKLAAGAAHPTTLRRHPNLLSGLLRCVLCGGSYTIYSSGRLICTTHREKGEAACANRRTPSKAAVEAKVIEGLQQQLASPEAVATYVRTYHKAAASRRASRLEATAPLQRRLGELERSIERVVDAIVRGSATAAMEARMMEMEKERLAVQAQLDGLAKASDTVELHPNSADAYIALIDQLRTTLAELATDATESQRRLKDAVRGLIDRIVIAPLTQERGGPIDIVIYGRLADFLDHEEEPTGNVLLGQVVAGGGIEPPT